MLKEYPGHPAASMIRSAAPISIYGVLVGCFGTPPFLNGHIDHIVDKQPGDE